MSDYIITISEAFSFFIINVKPLKGAVIKKLQKVDVTIDITSNKCYSTNIRCNKQCYNKLRR